MMNFLQSFEEKLALINPESDGFELQMDNLIESLGSVTQAKQKAVIPLIFQFFEKYPLNEMGIPGTFTHFIEDFWPNYSDTLFKSITRQPSIASILMVNRVLNSKLTTADRKKFTQALQQVVDNKIVDDELCNYALEFLDYQQQK